MYDNYNDRITTDPENIEWKRHAREGRKVDAIKSFRVLTGAGLKPAKDVVEEYCIVNQRRAAAETVTTRTVQLPGGAALNIISNGKFSAIQYTRNEAINLSDDELPQAIADAVLRHLHENTVA